MIALTRRSALVLGSGAVLAPIVGARSVLAQGALTPPMLNEALNRAAKLSRLHSLVIAQNGTILAERVYRGPGLERPVNIKSASKVIISALVGIAVEKGLLKDTAQPVTAVLTKRIPDGADPRLRQITVEHLLTMRSGLERTSGGNYGRWVSSPNWVRYVLTRPFVDQPGGNMLYSTGSTHLLSAMLTDLSGRSTWELARDWLGEPLGIAVPQWTRDPQGIYFGGNEMALSPRALFRFGEMYRNRGVSDGVRIVPESWVRESWTPKTYDRGRQMYGYGWFITQSNGHPIYNAWGFGGQMLYVVPSLGLTIVATSDHTTRSVEDGYRCDLHGLVSDGVIPAALEADPALKKVPLLQASWSYPPLGGRRCIAAYPGDIPA